MPARPPRVPGLAMAGFGDGANAVVDVDLVPHPTVTVLFDLGAEPVTVEDADGQRRRGRVVAGLAPRGARGRGLAGSFVCLQVRLSPLLAHGVLGASAELGGTLSSLDDLWGRDGVRVEERLRAAGSWDERFAIAEAAVARRLGAGPSVDPEVAHCWRRMLTAPGRARVEELAAEVGWSRKRLWARFRDQVGLGPRRAAQLVRFDHAAHRLAAGDGAALVAATSGYTDQSHLHREVVAFSGVTPAALATAPFLAVDDVAWPAGSSRR